MAILVLIETPYLTLFLASLCEEFAKSCPIDDFPFSKNRV